MKEYVVFITAQANNELYELVDYIANVVFSPMAAKVYYDGIIEEINKLRILAGSLQIDEKLSLQVGCVVRRTRYKKIAIIYSVDGDIVYVHHIKPGAMIIY